MTHTVKKIYGIVGHPLTYSFSPILQGAAFEAEGIEAEFRKFDFDPAQPGYLENFCYESDLNGVGGFCVTMPYKEEITRLMDYYDPLAKKLGSVNTVKNEDSNLIGYNTDLMGAIKSLEEVTRINGKKALVLGAGGAARAISFGLKSKGTDVFVFNRSAARARELADTFDLETMEYRDIEKTDFDIIINATPVGRAPKEKESLLKAEQIKKGALVMDIVTQPLETRLLKEAKKAGAKTISGERMLLHQAAEQFEIWFDKKAPLEVMEKALYEELKRRV